jgi:translation elongation factor EF-Tu-like GTPase
MNKKKLREIFEHRNDHLDAICEEIATQEVMGANRFVIPIPKSDKQKEREAKKSVEDYKTKLTEVIKEYKDEYITKVRQGFNLIVEELNTLAGQTPDSQEDD